MSDPAPLGCPTANSDAPDELLATTITRPRPDTAVLHVLGEVDTLTAPRRGSRSPSASSSTARSAPS